MTNLKVVRSKQEFVENAKRLLACTRPTARNAGDPATVEYRTTKRLGNLVQIDYSSDVFTAENIIRAVDLTESVLILGIRGKQ